MPPETRGRNLGYKIQAELPLNNRDTVRIGSEYHSNRKRQLHRKAGPMLSIWETGLA